MKYSSKKSLLLDLTFITPVDDLNKQLFLVISDVSTFGELLPQLLNVEFCKSTRADKRKSDGNEIEKAKRPRPETSRSVTSPLSNCTASQQPSQPASPVPASVSTSVIAGNTTSTSSSTLAVSAKQHSLNEDGDDVVDLSQQRYAVSLRELNIPKGGN